MFLGKSARGKSHFIRYLLQDRFANGGWKFGMVFCPTAFTGDYNWPPKKAVRLKYDEPVLMKYVNNLKKIVDEKKQDGKKIDPNFIIFDDVIGVLRGQTEFFINFMGSFRHTRTSIIIASQYMTARNSISTVMRAQVNYAFLFKTRNKIELENYYNNFGQLFDSYNEFVQYFKDNTEQEYVCILWLDTKDDLEENYLPVIAPAELDDIKIEF
jgi:hypothetical protein